MHFVCAVAREARGLYAPHSKHAWICEQLLEAQRSLIDKVLKKIRGLAHAVFDVKVEDAIPCTAEAFERTCDQCGGLVFLVSVHGRHPMGDCEPRSVEGQPHAGAADRNVLCLECALGKRPPLTGYDITVPSCISLSISRQTEPACVVTRIANGVRSALPSTHLLDSSVKPNLRWQPPRHLMAASDSNLEPGMSFKSTSEASPVAKRPCMKESMHVEPSASQFEWSEVERQMSKDVQNAKDLMEVEIPAVAPTEPALQLKLKQKQLKRALHETLTAPDASRTHQPITKVDPEETASVRQQLESLSQSCEGEAADASRHSCDFCLGFFRDATKIQGKTCLQLIHEMESKPAVKPVRFISVPTSRTKMHTESVPVIYTPAYPTLIQRRTKITKPPSIQSIACILVQAHGDVSSGGQARCESEIQDHITKARDDCHCTSACVGKL